MVAIPAYLLASSAVTQLGPLTPLNKVIRSPVAQPASVAKPQTVSTSESSGAFGSVLGPIISSNFPDPAIYWEDGVTYAFATNNRGESPVGMIHVQVATSRDNKTWELSTQDALPQVGAWETGTKVWAPDVIKVVSLLINRHFLKNTNPTQEDGTYVMYYTDALASRPQSHCVGVATSHTIMGPYTPQPNAWACPDPATLGGAIDPDGFFDVSTNKRYVTYKVDGNSIGHGGSCNNAVAPIVPTPILLQEVGPDGTSLIGAPIPILDRDDSDGPLIEAPSLARSDEGIYFLFFSSNCFTTPLYDTSYATATSITGPYTKTSRPLLITGDGPDLVGPGGLDVITDGSAVLFHGHLTVQNDAVFAGEGAEDSGGVGEAGEGCGGAVCAGDVFWSCDVCGEGGFIG